MKKEWIYIFILSIVVFMANTWGASIYILDEAKNATCAKEMLSKADLVVPTFNGGLRTDKPPLHYYFMMLAYTLFGVSPFSARFFSACCGILTVMSSYAFAYRYMGRRTALYTAIVLLAALQVGLQFKLAVPDPYLILLLTLAFFSFFIADREGNTIVYYGAYTFLALAFLTKGPMALALPGLVMVLYVLWSGGKWWDWARIRNFRPLSGLALFLAIVTPWYLSVGVATDWEWTRAFFLHHNLGRYTSTMEGHGGFFLQVPLLVLVGLLPFSLFFPQAAFHAWKQRENNLLKFGLLVITVFIVFFSFSKTKLPSYPAPCFPFVALLLGNFLAQTIEKKAMPKAYRLVAALVIGVVLTLAIPLGVYIGVSQDASLSHLSWVSVWFAILPLGTIAALVFALRQQWEKAYITLGGAFVLLMLLFNYYLFPQFDKENPVKLATDVMQKEPHPVAYYGRMNPAFAFYMDKTIPKLENIEAVRSFLERHQQAYLITTEKHWPSPQDIRLQQEELELIVRKKDLFESPTTIVLRK